MKINYFSKIENKYVFNLSLIFWHLFIVLSTIAVAISLLFFLWSVTPTFKKEVEKEPYPEKQAYPAPVKVNLSDLKLDENKQVENLPVDERVNETPKVIKKQLIEDVIGKKEYENSFNTLKTLIPPAKYSWTGEGYWVYPYGERYWDVYKQEQYRSWVSTEDGIDDKLSTSYNKAKANNYIKKKQILDGYISVVKLLKEDKRVGGLQSLMSYVANNMAQNDSICKSLVKVVSKMSDADNTIYLDQLARFGKNNSNNNGAPFINYIAFIINKFDNPQRSIAIDNLVNSYYGYFNQDFNNQKEATNLFLPLLPGINKTQQGNALNKYYSVYLNKNIERTNKIAQIESEQQEKMAVIDVQFNNEQIQAESDFYSKKESKQNLRYKSMMAIGISILIIVLIATILVFFSIQRSVRKIEEKITINQNTQV